MIVPSLITNTELYDCTGCEFNNFEYYVAEVPPSLQAPTWNQDLVTNYGAQWLFCMACCNVYTGGELVPSTGDKIYKFLTSFEIPQECTVDSTTLKITADDFVTEVMLNGNSVDLTTNPSGTTDSSAEEEVHTYLIDPSWFAPGSNTFTVELKDCFGSDPLCGAGHIGGIWCLVIYFQ